MALVFLFVCLPSPIFFFSEMVAVVVFPCMQGEAHGSQRVGLPRGRWRWAEDGAGKLLVRLV